MAHKIEHAPCIDISLFVKNGINDNQSNISFNEGGADYNIRIAKVKSNLGQGYLYYFICPHTYKKCRKLYKPKGSDKWLSRTAYKRFYYASQLESKDDRKYKYHRFNRKAEELESKIIKSHYKGKATKPQQRLLRLECKATKYERIALAGLTNFLASMGRI